MATVEQLLKFAFKPQTGAHAHAAPEDAFGGLGNRRGSLTFGARRMEELSETLPTARAVISREEEVRFWMDDFTP